MGTNQVAVGLILKVPKVIFGSKFIFEGFSTMGAFFVQRSPIRFYDRDRLLLAGMAGFISIASLTVGYMVLRRPAKVIEVVREANVAQVEVLVPVRNINPGEALEPGMFRKSYRPSSTVSEKIIRDFEAIRGQYAKSMVVAGEPIHLDYLAGDKPTSPISSEIPNGFRAVTIRVNDLTAVDGFATRGEKVDVSWIESLSGKAQLSTIVQNARIVSINRQLEENWRPGNLVPGTATLVANEYDARRIQLASASGTLSLSLRSQSDPGLVNPKPISADQIRWTTEPGSEPKSTCNGTLKVCDKNKQCEVLCIGPNGELTPMPTSSD